MLNAAFRVYRDTPGNAPQEIAHAPPVHHDQSIRVVDLQEAIAAAKGEIAVIDMEQTEQAIANVSTQVTKLKAD
jgi:hypothetical protein